jgi:O-antigen ligase
LGIIGFGAIILGGIPFSFWPGGTYTVLTEVYVKVVLVFMAMIATLTTVAKIRSFLWTIVLGSTYVAAMTIANFARGASVVEGDRLTGAGGGVFGNPNDLALNMLAFLPFTLVLALHSARALSRWFAGLAALLMLTCTVLTKSRGGFLGLIAVVLVLFLLGGRIKRGFRVVIVAACLLTLPLLPASFWSRMGSLTGATEDETGSWDARQRLLQDGWQAFCERPLMGVGAGQFQAYNMPWRREPWRETHNVWLQVAAEMGVVGVVAFAFLVLRGFSAAFVASRLKRTWRAPTGTAHSAETASSVDPERKRQSAELRTLQLYGTASLAALAGWAVTAMFASVAYNWTFYYLLGFAAATRDAAKGVRTATRRPAPKAPRAGVAAGQA